MNQWPEEGVLDAAGITKRPYTVRGLTAPHTLRRYEQVAAWIAPLGLPFEWEPRSAGLFGERPYTSLPCFSVLRSDGVLLAIVTLPWCRAAVALSGARSGVGLPNIVARLRVQPPEERVRFGEVYLLGGVDAAQALLWRS